MAAKGNRLKGKVALRMSRDIRRRISDHIN